MGCKSSLIFNYFFINYLLFYQEVWVCVLILLGGQGSKG